MECIPSDGCCPNNCAYSEDSDCTRPSVVFSEINYNLNGTDDNYEWIEIFNNGTVAVDITKWKFIENGTNHRIDNTTDYFTLEPQFYAIIAQNPGKFSSDYPDFSGMLLDSAFSLNNSGEPLALKMWKDGEISDSLYYKSAWGGDGTGFSLEKINLSGPNTQENWNQSLEEKGTPGKQNSVSA